MPRPNRTTSGGTVYHVLNRGVGRRTLFQKEEDYAAFEKILGETLRISPIRICAYCLMPNHWHFVMWPENDRDLPVFMQQLTNTHVKRWKEHYDETGLGPLYQGRYKSFPVETDNYFHQVVRYVERNALRAGLVTNAEDWPWSSLYRRSRGLASTPLLSQWPLPCPDNWTEVVNEPQSEAEMATLQHCIRRGRPLGSTEWVAAVAGQLGLELTLRSRGRPRKAT